MLSIIKLCVMLILFGITLAANASNTLLVKVLLDILIISYFIQPPLTKET